jgi:pSer/pThr/pTyr-binding forkhead associated (FHA) protein
VVRLVREVALGLAALHAAGLVHRDVKPANVLVGPTGRAKLVDLGLAKDAFQSGLTAPGALLGTVEYMAPEQWASSPCDARTDVFGLGATLYALLVGHPPYQGEDLGELADRATAGDLVRPRAVVPDVPPEVERAVLRMLDPEPAWRHGSAEAAARDLEGLLAGGLARVPCLTSSTARLVLHPGRRFTLGAGPGVELPVVGPGVAPRHAELRRKAGGFQLACLRAPGGTFVGADRLSAPRELKAGDVVRLGEVALVYDAATDEEPAEAWRRDVTRRLVPEPVLLALVAQADPRTTAALLERLAPDPLDEERARRTLDALGAPDVLAVRKALLARERAGLPLVRAAGDSGPDLAAPGDWLAWWDAARTSAPEQVGEEGRPPGLVLRLVSSGVGSGAGLRFDQAPDVALLGRDPRCALALADPTVSKRHAAVLRLHRRLVVRNDDPGLGTLHDAGAGATPLDVAFLDPGHTLVVGAVELRLEAADETTRPTPLGGGALRTDGATQRALEEAGHPAAAACAVAALDPAGVARWAAGWAAQLSPRDPARLQAALVAGQAARAARLRPWLARLAGANIAGEDRGADVAAWRAALSARGLGPQGLPSGWPV